MSITSLMKNLLLALLLISPASFADWGDVYYCQMTNSSTVNNQGIRKSHILEKFKINLNKEENAVIFGSTSAFEHDSIEVDWLFDERLTAKGDYSLLRMDHGKFHYAFIWIGTGIYVITADCDKF